MENEVDLERAQERVSQILNGESKQRKQRSDKGVPKGPKLRGPDGKLTAQQRIRIMVLCEDLAQAEVNKREAIEKLSRAEAAFKDFLDSITAQ